MKVLFIGGTGNISIATSKLAVERGLDLYHLNRGHQGVTIPGVKNSHGGYQEAGSGGGSAARQPV